MPVPLDCSFLIVSSVLTSVYYMLRWLTFVNVYSNNAKCKCLNKLPYKYRLDSGNYVWEFKKMILQIDIKFSAHDAFL
jgi:hypothetical protein